MFHYRNQGWTVGDHLSAFQLDVLNMLWWAKTKDGQDNRNRPQPTPRPTAPVQQTEPDDEEDAGWVMTVEDYVRMVAEAQEQELADEED